MVNAMSRSPVILAAFTRLGQTPGLFHFDSKNVIAHVLVHVNGCEFPDPLGLSREPSIASLPQPVALFGL
jgi:hypothetical protein